MNVTSTGSGVAREPGTFAAPSSLPPGPVEIAIASVAGENDGLFQRDAAGNPVRDGNNEPLPARSECVMVACVYPDGYTKSHQIRVLGEGDEPLSPQSCLDDLLNKVVRQVRVHYGVTGDLPITAAPAELKAGEKIILGGN